MHRTTLWRHEHELRGRHAARSQDPQVKAPERRRRVDPTLPTLLAVDPPVWMQRAACVGLVDERWHDTRARPDPLFVAVCAGCPVAGPCLAWGEATSSSGLFGGVQLVAGRRRAAVAA